MIWSLPSRKSAYVSRSFGITPGEKFCTNTSLIATSRSSVARPTGVPTSSTSEPFFP